jgi:gas vesicle protein
MSDDRCCSGSGGVFLAFLAGGLVGAGFALLYAPVSGREARERIGGLTEDLKKKTDGWSGDVKQKVEGFIDEERSVIKAAYEAGREAMSREKARFEKPNPNPNPIPE